MVKHNKLMLDILCLASCVQNNLVWVIVVLVYKGKIFLLSLLDQTLCLPSGPLPHAKTYTHKLIVGQVLQINLVSYLSKI